MTEAIKQWIGDGRTIETDAFDDITLLAKAVLSEFWSHCPDHRTTDNREAIEQLHSIAKTAGFEGGVQMCGSAVVHGDGKMTLELRA